MCLEANLQHRVCQNDDYLFQFLRIIEYKTGDKFFDTDRGRPCLWGMHGRQQDYRSDAMSLAKCPVFH